MNDSDELYGGQPQYGGGQESYDSSLGFDSPPRYGTKTDYGTGYGGLDDTGGGGGFDDTGGGGDPYAYDMGDEMGGPPKFGKAESDDDSLDPFAMEERKEQKKKTREALRAADKSKSKDDRAKEILAAVKAKSAAKKFKSLLGKKDGGGGEEEGSPRLGAVDEESAVADSEFASAFNTFKVDDFEISGLEDSSLNNALGLTGTAAAGKKASSGEEGQELGSSGQPGDEEVQKEQGKKALEESQASDSMDDLDPAYFEVGALQKKSLDMKKKAREEEEEKKKKVEEEKAEEERRKKQQKEEEERLQKEKEKEENEKEEKRLKEEAARAEEAYRRLGFSPEESADDEPPPAPPPPHDYDEAPGGPAGSEDPLGTTGQLSLVEGDTEYADDFHSRTHVEEGFPQEEEEEEEEERRRREEEEEAELSAGQFGAAPMDPEDSQGPTGDTVAFGTITNDLHRAMAEERAAGAAEAYSPMSGQQSPLPTVEEGMRESAAESNLAYSTETAHLERQSIPDNDETPPPRPPESSGAPSSLDPGSPGAAVAAAAAAAAAAVPTPRDSSPGPPPGPPDGSPPPAEEEEEEEGYRATDLRKSVRFDDDQNQYASGPVHTVQQSWASSERDESPGPPPPPPAEDDDEEAVEEEQGPPPPPAVPPGPAWDVPAAAPTAADLGALLRRLKDLPAAPGPGGAPAAAAAAAAAGGGGTGKLKKAVNSKLKAVKAIAETKKKQKAAGARAKPKDEEVVARELRELWDQKREFQAWKGQLEAAAEQLRAREEEILAAERGERSALQMLREDLRRKDEEGEAERERAAALVHSLKLELEEARGRLAKAVAAAERGSRDHEMGMEWNKSAMQTLQDQYKELQKKYDFDMKQKNAEISGMEAIIRGYQDDNMKLIEKMKAKETELGRERGRLFRDREALRRRLLNAGAEDAGAASSAEGPGGGGGGEGAPAAAAATAQERRSAQAAALRANLEAAAAAEALREELGVARAREAELKFEVARLRKEAEAARAAAEHTLTELSGARDRQTAELRGDLQAQLNQAEEENLNLREKVAWYTRNQELLDDMHGRLKDKEVELEAARAALAEAGSAAPSRGKGGGEAAAAKKVRALEARLAEAEEALRRRHPDSLANLIRAAGPSDSVVARDAASKQRVGQLEAELAAAKEDAERRLRSLRQEHEKVKDALLAQLEEQAASAAAGGGGGGGEGGGGVAGALCDNLEDAQARIDELGTKLERSRKFYETKINDMKKGHERQMSALRRGGDLNDRELRIKDLEHQLQQKTDQLKRPQSHPPQQQAPAAAAALPRLYARAEAAEREAAGLRSQLATARAFQEELCKPSGGGRGAWPGGGAAAAAAGAEAEARAAELERQLLATAEALGTAQARARILEAEAEALRERAAPPPPPPGPLGEQQRAPQLLQGAAALAARAARAEAAARERGAACEALAEQCAELQRRLAAAGPQGPAAARFLALGRRVEELRRKNNERDRELAAAVRRCQDHARQEAARLQALHVDELREKDRQIDVFREELEAIMASMTTLNNAS